MIKIENVMVTGWEPAIRGARNPMNSWEKSDSWFGYGDGDIYWDINHNSGPLPDGRYGKTLEIGPNDLKLLSNLAKAGSDEAKFRRMIVVYLDLRAPMYWWKEADTYKVGTVRNSCSTMHKIHAKEFTLEDFSVERLFSKKDFINGDKTVPFENDPALSAITVDGDIAYFTSTGFVEMTCDVLNHYRDLFLQTNDKKCWWQMIQLLPSSYNQRATLMLNYEVLANMYHARKNHKLDEWREFCAWIETLPYAKELIICPTFNDMPTSPLLDPNYNGGEQ